MLDIRKNAGETSGRKIHGQAGAQGIRLPFGAGRRQRERQAKPGVCRRLRGVLWGRLGREQDKSPLFGFLVLSPQPDLAVTAGSLPHGTGGRRGRYGPRPRAQTGGGRVGTEVYPEGESW